MIFPEHIRSNVVNIKKHKNNIYSGKLTCCEQNNFKVYCTSNNNDNIVCIAKCLNCLKEYEIYNSLTQGYDNCLDIKKDIKKNVNLFVFKCKKCNNNIYNVYLKYEYPPIKELGYDHIESIPNAFSWIWISFKCSSCNKKYKNYINMETS